MSQTKGVEIRGRLVWVWDNSLEVVLARMIGAADGIASLADELDTWRLAASTGDYGLTFSADTDAQRGVLEAVLARARVAIEAHGDVMKKDLVGWSVLEGVEVADGHLRVEPLPVAALLDVLETFEDLIAGRFPPDPPNDTWLVGAPSGRTTVSGRPVPAAPTR